MLCELHSRYFSCLSCPSINNVFFYLSSKVGRKQKVGDGVLDEVGVAAVLAFHGALHNASLDK